MKYQAHIARLLMLGDPSLAADPTRLMTFVRREMAKAGKQANLQGVVEVPKNTHPVKVEPPRAKRKKFPFVGYIDFQGLQIDVENKKGDTRKGVSGDGTEWSTYMHNHYGEIRKTEGADGDKLDVYVGPNHDSSLVVVVHQHQPDTGNFDEDKVMIGFDSEEEAIGAYKKQYDRPGFFVEGEYLSMPMGQFWRWVHDDRNRGKKIKEAAARLADRYAKTFTINPGDPVLYGKFLNKPGKITGFGENEKGDPTVTIKPDKGGQDKEQKLLKIREAPAGDSKAALAGHTPEYIRLLNQRRVAVQSQCRYPLGGQSASKVAARYRLARRIARVEVRPRQWELASPEKLDSLQADRLWSLYHTSYGNIGMHIPTVHALLKDHDLLWLQDVDGDLIFDAFIGYKRSPAGNKLALMGSDGSTAAKRAVVAKSSELLRSNGWYAELSHRPAELMERAGVPKVTSEQVVRETLRKDIEWLGDGNYRRQIGSLGVLIKALYGNPRVQSHGDLTDKVAARYKNKKTVKTQDGKDMTVYEYSDRQVANRNREKAEKVEKLRKGIGDLRAQYRKDLKSADPKTKLTALVVGLMDETYERVGNEDSANEGHFGVTGWKVKHITLGRGHTATIKYVGKSGVKQEKKVEDAGLVAALRDALKGKKDNDPICVNDECSVTAEDVNAYLKPFGVSAKDLRGFHANDEMQTRLKAVRAEGGKLPEDKKEREKQLKDEFKKALEETAEAVGHEASTLKSQYLVPGLEDEFLKDGEVSEKLNKKAARPIPMDRKELDKAVKFISDGMKTLSTYEPEEPISSEPNPLMSTFMQVKNAQGQDTKVAVFVEHKKSGLDYGVLDAGYGKAKGQPVIILYVNGKFPKSYFTGGHAAKQLSQSLAHEVTHAMDPNVKKDKNKVNPEDTDWSKYYNDPREVRAHMRELYERVASEVRDLMDKRGRKWSLDHVLSLALKRSEKWVGMQPHLSALSRKQILKGLVRQLQDEGFAGPSGSLREKFLEIHYEGGKKKVPNPNPKTKDKVPEVSLSTALAYPEWQKKIDDEFHQWRDKKTATQHEALGPKEIVTQVMVNGVRPSTLKTAAFLALATKTPLEREDEAAEKLIRPSPKKKPPRHDLRNERVDAEKDPDSERPGADNDPDLSKNYKKVGLSLEKWAEELGHGGVKSMEELSQARDKTSPGTPAAKKREEPHLPGRPWRTESGTWGAIPQGKGPEATKYFPDQKQAEQYAKGGYPEGEGEGAEGGGGAHQAEAEAPKPEAEKTEAPKPGPKAQKPSVGELEVLDQDLKRYNNLLAKKQRVLDDPKASEADRKEAERVVNLSKEKIRLNGLERENKNHPEVLQDKVKEAERELKSLEMSREQLESPEFSDYYTPEEKDRELGRIDRGRQEAEKLLRSLKERLEGPPETPKPEAEAPKPAEAEPSDLEKEWGETAPPPEEGPPEDPEALKKKLEQGQDKGKEESKQLDLKSEGYRGPEDEPSFEDAGADKSAWEKEHHVQLPGGGAVLGTPHQWSGEEAAKYVKDTVIPKALQVAEQAIKDGKKVVFLSENQPLSELDQEKVGPSHWDEQHEVAKALKDKFGDQVELGTWDEGSSGLTPMSDQKIHMDSPLAKRLVSEFKDSDLVEAAVFAMTQGQSPDAEVLDLSPEAERGLRKLGIDPKDPEALYKAAFPQDSGDPENDISKITSRYNELRDEELVQKVRDYDAKGMVPIVTPGASHAYQVKPVLEKGTSDLEKEWGETAPPPEGEEQELDKEDMLPLEDQTLAPPPLPKEETGTRELKDEDLEDTTPPPLPEGTGTSEVKDEDIVDERDSASDLEKAWGDLALDELKRSPEDLAKEEKGSRQYKEYNERVLKDKNSSSTDKKRAQEHIDEETENLKMLALEKKNPRHPDVLKHRVKGLERKIKQTEKRIHEMDLHDAPHDKADKLLESLQDQHNRVMQYLKRTEGQPVPESGTDVDAPAPPRKGEPTKPDTPAALGGGGEAPPAAPPKGEGTKPATPAAMGGEPAEVPPAAGGGGGEPPSGTKPGVPAAMPEPPAPAEPESVEDLVSGMDEAGFKKLMGELKTFGPGGDLSGLKDSMPVTEGPLPQLMKELGLPAKLFKTLGDVRKMINNQKELKKLVGTKPAAGAPSAAEPFDSIDRNQAQGQREQAHQKVLDAHKDDPEHPEVLASEAKMHEDAIKDIGKERAHRERQIADLEAQIENSEDKDEKAQLKDELKAGKQTLSDLGKEQKDAEKALKDVQKKQQTRQKEQEKEEAKKQKDLEKLEEKKRKTKPLKIDGQEVTDDEKDDEELNQRAQAAYNEYVSKTESQRQGALQQALDDWDENAGHPNARKEIDRVIDGLHLAEVMHADPEDDDSGALLDANGKVVRKAPPRQFKILAHALASQGKADLLVAPHDLHAPSGREVVTKALADLDDRNLFEVVGGEKGPMGDLIRELNDTIEEDRFGYQAPEIEYMKGLMRRLAVDDMTLMHALHEGSKAARSKGKAPAKGEGKGKSEEAPERSFQEVLHDVYDGMDVKGHAKKVAALRAAGKIDEAEAAEVEFDQEKFRRMLNTPEGRKLDKANPFRVQVEDFIRTGDRKVLDTRYVRPGEIPEAKTTEEMGQDRPGADQDQYKPGEVRKTRNGWRGFDGDDYRTFEDQEAAQAFASGNSTVSYDMQRETPTRVAGDAAFSGWTFCNPYLP